MFVDEDRSVDNSCCWALPAQSFSGLSLAVLMTIFYCLKFETPPNLEGQVSIFISPRNRVAQLFPQALGMYPPGTGSGSPYMALTLVQWKTPFTAVPPLLHQVFVAVETNLFAFS
jgi:hypothetical protein